MSENPKVPHPAKRRGRGVTLIEAVLYIAIALALIVGGLVFYQQAALASRVNATARLLGALVAEMRVVAAEVPYVFMTSAEAEEVLVSRGSVPNGHLDLTQPPQSRIRDPWDRPLLFDLFQDLSRMQIGITSNRFPVEACARLAAMDLSGGTTFTNGVFRVTLRDDLIPTVFYLYPGDGPAQAATACRAADRNRNGLVYIRFLIQR